MLLLVLGMSALLQADRGASRFIAVAASSLVALGRLPGAAADQFAPPDEIESPAMNAGRALSETSPSLPPPLSPDMSYVEGACGKADVDATDCSTDDQGSWWLTKAEAASQQRAITACEARCHACTGCRFVSLSWRERDCSWYTSCDLKNLRRSRTHRTRAVAAASERATSYELWLRNATEEAFPATKLTPLEHFYRLEWQRRFDQTPGNFHFLSLPWHEIVEGPMNEGPSLRDLRLARRLWNRLDWSRRHFILLNQCSMTQLNLHRGGDSGFQWMRDDRLTVFDSRLWGLQLAAAGRASAVRGGH